MTLGRTFKLPQYMPINVENKTMHNIYSFVTSFGVKGQINESHQIVVKPKAFEPLMLET